MPESSKHKRWWKKIIIPILVVMLLGAVALSVYFYREVESLRGGSDVVAEEEVAELTALVGELIVLPTDELPTVATVVDPEKLRDQAFFANAKSGDRVLLYSVAKKAILYDPIAHKIVEVAPINIGADEATPEPSVAGTTDETPVEPTPTPSE